MNAQFKVHFDLLMEWNAKINLTSIRDPEEIVRRHFEESAYFTQVVPLGVGTLIDIGSGAGFPGIPIKVLSPQTRVVLIESIQKKARFLQLVVDALGLPGLEVFPGRLEDFPETDVDWATMRAVRLDKKLLRAVKRIVPRGTFAPFLTENDAPPMATVYPIPGSDMRVIAVGECSTWNINKTFQPQINADERR